MAEGKLDSADFEDSPLPGAEAPDFDLSDETSTIDGNGVAEEQLSEEVTQGEPEGIFALFDREFPEGHRTPIGSEESSEFDAEFSSDFEEMFQGIKGDGSAPLFEDIHSNSSSESSKSIAAGDEENVLPIPGSEPKRIDRNSQSFEDEDALPVPGSYSATDDRLDDADYEDEIPLIDPSVPMATSSDQFVSSIPPEEEEPLADLRDDFDSALEEPKSESKSPLGSNESDDLAPWSPDEDGLEELSFDDSDDDELYDTDLAAPEEDEGDSDGNDFDEFARMALGLPEEDEEDEVSEDEDFKLEELNGAEELDPFEDIAIMSSEDVAKYEPSFGEEELKFQDEEPLPEDPDPFAMENEEDSKFSHSESDYDPLKEIDPFSEEAEALSEQSANSIAPSKDELPDGSDEPEKGNKPKREKKPRAGRGLQLPTGLKGILFFPWRIYSTFTTILFRLLEGLIGILAKIPFIGIPFRMLGSVLSAIPMALKRVIVLLVIGFIAWGSTSLINGFLPKPSADISLPDSGSARFIGVELKDGMVTGQIENTGDVNLQVFPQAKIFERQLLNPGTWFNPTEKGVCEGNLIEVAIDATVKVSYSCSIATDGIISIEPMLKD